MSDELENLQQQHRAKTLEIEAAVVRALGVRAAESEGEAENLIVEFENAMMNGETPTEWQAHEIRVAGTPIGKLLVERYEIAEQILDIQDAHFAFKHD